jgi:ADP-ribose pyrophosphatase YjhB (NUDIX family)
MSAMQPIAVGRRAARGIVIDDEGRLILEDALRRELAEELGATADGYQQVFLTSDPTDAGVAIQYFFVARLTSLHLAERYGPELASPERGAYDVDYVSLRDDSLNAIDLKPTALKDFVLANRDALLVEASLPA